MQGHSVRESVSSPVSVPAVGTESAQLDCSVRQKSSCATPEVTSEYIPGKNKADGLPGDDTLGHEICAIKGLEGVADSRDCWKSSSLDSEYNENRVIGDIRLAYTALPQRIRANVVALGGTPKGSCGLTRYVNYARSEPSSLDTRECKVGFAHRERCTMSPPVGLREDLTSACGFGFAVRLRAKDSAGERCKFSNTLAIESEHNSNRPREDFYRRSQQSLTSSDTLPSIDDIVLEATDRSKSVPSSSACGDRTGIIPASMLLVRPQVVPSVTSDETALVEPLFLGGRDTSVKEIIKRLSADIEQVRVAPITGSTNIEEETPADGGTAPCDEEPATESEIDDQIDNKIGVSVDRQGDRPVVSQIHVQSSNAALEGSCARLIGREARKRTRSLESTCSVVREDSGASPNRLENAGQEKRRYFRQDTGICRDPQEKEDVEAPNGTSMPSASDNKDYEEPGEVIPPPDAFGAADGRPAAAQIDVHGAALLRSQSEGRRHYTKLISSDKMTKLRNVDERNAESAASVLSCSRVHVREAEVTGSWASPGTKSVDDTSKRQVLISGQNSCVGVSAIHNIQFEKTLPPSPARLRKGRPLLGGVSTTHSSARDEQNRCYGSTGTHSRRTQAGHDLEEVLAVPAAPTAARSTLDDEPDVAYLRGAHSGHLQVVPDPEGCSSSVKSCGPEKNGHHGAPDRTESVRSCATGDMAVYCEEPRGPSSKRFRKVAGVCEFLFTGVTTGPGACATRCASISHLRSKQARESPRREVREKEELSAADEDDHGHSSTTVRTIAGARGGVSVGRGDRGDSSVQLAGTRSPSHVMCSVPAAHAVLPATPDRHTRASSFKVAGRAPAVDTAVLEPTTRDETGVPCTCEKDGNVEIEKTSILLKSAELLNSTMPPSPPPSPLSRPVDPHSSSPRRSLSVAAHSRETDSDMSDERSDPAEGALFSPPRLVARRRYERRLRRQREAVQESVGTRNFVHVANSCFPPESRWNYLPM